jgi:hypothetical protein
MAKNWTAYEAAKEIIEGKNKENICEIGSRYPMLTREVAVAGDKILVILKALPKVTARVLETGLKDGVEAETEAEEETKETENDAEAEDELDYTDMTGANLYKLCCARGISSKCKSRKKDALIELLEKFDRGELDEEESKKEAKKAKAASKKQAKKEEEPVDEDDDWDTEDEEEKDPYEGKTAKELFNMCTERGIKTKPKQKADAYVKLLKKADAESEAEEAEDDEDDDWEI